MGPGLRYVAEIVFSLGFGYAFLAQVTFYHAATMDAAMPPTPLFGTLLGPGFSSKLCIFLKAPKRATKAPRGRPGGQLGANLGTK